MVFLSKKNQSPTEEEVIINSSDESISLGEKLKEQRLKLGLSVEDVCAKTKIRKAFIIAIENNDLEILPGKVYIHGFLNNYVKLLGLPTDIINYDLSCVQDIKKNNQPPFKFYVYSEKSYTITKKTFVISLLLLLCVLGISKLTEENPSSAITHNDSNNMEEKKPTPSSNVTIYHSNVPGETDTKLSVPAVEIENKTGNTNIGLSPNQANANLIEDKSITTPPLPIHNGPAALPKVEESKPSYSTIDGSAEAETKSEYLSEDLNPDDDDDD